MTHLQRWSRRHARHNIPRGCRTNFVPGLTDESKMLYQEYIERFEKDPFSADTLEAGQNLSSVITECRRRKWQDFIQSTDMTHSSRKAWKTIRVLGNDYTKTQPRSEVTPDQVAHQLLKNSQGNPDHRPRRAKVPKAPVACSPESQGFTRPFNLTELCDAIHIMKNNKAAGLDDILCEQIKHFGPGALDW